MENKIRLLKERNILIFRNDLSTSIKDKFSQELKDLLKFYDLNSKDYYVIDKLLLDEHLVIKEEKTNRMRKKNFIRRNLRNMVYN